MALTDKNAFCTLADLKDELGITDSSQDARLERRILGASDMIERFLNRPVRREVNRIEYLPGYGGANLLPSLTPIESIASIEMDGEVIPPDAYEITSNKLFVFSSTGWEWTALGLQTISRELVMVPGTEREAFKVTFTGGWCLPNDTTQAGTLLPVAITEACLQLATTLHLQRGTNRAIAAEAVGEASVQMRADTEGSVSNGIPAGIASMLSAFKRAV